MNEDTEVIGLEAVDVEGLCKAAKCLISEDVHTCVPYLAYIHTGMSYILYCLDTGISVSLQFLFPVTRGGCCAGSPPLFLWLPIRAARNEELTAQEEV